jgi:hypothetical protein
MYKTDRQLDEDERRHIRLEHPDNSAVAENSMDHGHRIQFHSASILSAKTRYMRRIVGEAIAIELPPYNNIIDGAFVSVNHGSLLSAP